MTEEIVDKIIVLVLPFAIMLFCVWMADHFDNRFGK